MQVGRQAARDVLLEVVALVGVRRQPRREEPCERCLGRRRPAAQRRRRDRVIDRQRGQPAWSPPAAERPPAGHRRSDRSRHDRAGAAAAGRASGSGRGTITDVRGQRALQEPAERVRGRERVGGGAHRQQPVPVHLLEPHTHLPRGRRHHPRQHEGGVVVGHDDRRVRGQRGEQAPPRAGSRLDVREVADAAPAPGAPRCRPCRRARTGAGDRWPSGTRRAGARRRAAACRARAPTRRRARARSSR